MQTRAGILSPIVAVVMLSVCAALITSCGCKCRRGGDGAGGDSPDRAEPDLIEADIRLNEGGYAMGEPIVMTLEVTNRAERAITLTFPSAQRYDFIVKKGKQTIWQWSGGRMFAQVVGRYELAPGETISYEYTWDQTAADGTKPGLGAYTIEGLLMLSPPFRVGPETFGIVD
jgi:hypothetical protein